ncbi:hypothetical protein BKA67DRAFT_532728 [Truncatella angustata]|uniref:Uncharacterized protein n=1 Tax=Truncatella angustata TaxID=152316 RepID=A0A9P8USJ2_9PEZI|nr:uncharacterized protein BKA67DRAFT_532728 [Truncatella angustata]KAH6657521.1 hypothetical protein BKA67DRAFT_532728 [Truncatella angustata]
MLETRSALGFLMLCLFNCATAADSNEFISPNFQSSLNTGRFAGVSAWDLGLSQLIAFQSTWDEYKIELWQQNLDVGNATSSPTLVYEQDAGDYLPQSFYWTVQTYEIQLPNSPVFFFWLRDKNSHSQQSSAFF